MIDGRSIFNYPIKIDIKTYENIRGIATSQGNDCTTICLLDYLISKQL